MIITLLLLFNCIFSAVAEGIPADNPHFVLLFFMTQLFLRELAKCSRLIQVVPMDMSSYYGENSIRKKKIIMKKFVRNKNINFFPPLFPLPSTYPSTPPPSAKSFFFFFVVSAENLNRPGTSNFSNVISQILLCKTITPDFNAEEICSIAKDSEEIKKILQEMQEYMPQQENQTGNSYYYYYYHYSFTKQNKKIYFKF